MRKLVLCAALLAACNSSESIGAPSDQAGAPSSLVIVSGDAQSASTNATLTTPLAVVVRNAAGQGVAGVSVHFAIDSGGGALESSDVTTGGDGIAVAGHWTLGAVPGVQVVSATVAGLPPVRFHAVRLGSETLTLFENATVSAGGGTLRFSKPGDPLDGLTITIPSGAFRSETRWNVAVDKTTAVTIPSGVSQVGPTLVISNGSGMSDLPMTLTMPLVTSATDAIAPFYYDVATHTLEAIPLVDRTSTSATLVASHFSADLMAKPTASAGLAGAMRMSFGEIRIVWVTTSRANLVGTFNTGFLPGVDDWEFDNYGDFTAPDGICEGMSITAMYYWYFVKKAGGPALFHHFDTSLPDNWDNLDGIRFAGAVQRDYVEAFYAGMKQIASLQDAAMAHGTALNDLTATWILLALKTTHQPILIALHGHDGGHAVVAYAATATASHATVSVSDPNTHGNLSRKLDFEGNTFTPVDFATSASGPSQIFDEAYALGVSGQVPLDKVSTRYAEFTSGKAGADRYPHSYTFEVFDEIGQSWGALGSNFETTNQELKVRLNCGDCTKKDPDGTSTEPVSMWNGAGSQSVNNVPFLISTSGPLTAVGLAKSPYSTSPGFVEAKHFTVTYHPFALTPESVEVPPGTQIKFTAQPKEFGTPNATYSWQFGDGTTGALVTGDSTVTHTFDKEGRFTTTLVFRNGSGRILARRTTPIFIHVPFAVSITPGAITVRPDQAAEMMAISQGFKDVPHRFNWFVDGQFTLGSNDSTFSRAWTTEGTHVIKVQVIEAETETVRASATVTISVVKGTPAWRLTSFTRTGSVPLIPSAPESFATALIQFYTYLNQVETRPSDGLVFLPGPVGYTENGVYFHIAQPPGSGASLTYGNGGFVMMVARVLTQNNDIYGTFYNSTGGVGDGTIDGVGAQSFSFSGGMSWVTSIHATKTATGMSGTMTLGLCQCGNGWGGYRTYSFTAIRVGG